MSNKIQIRTKRRRPRRWLEVVQGDTDIFEFLNLYKGQKIKFKLPLVKQSDRGDLTGVYISTDGLGENRLGTDGSFQGILFQVIESSSGGGTSPTVSPRTSTARI